MPDTREKILARLFEVCGEEYIAAATIVRNRALLSEDVRPAIALLDGDEQARLTGDDGGRGNKGRIQMIAQLMTMTPQIFFIPKTRRPQNEGLGPHVNQFRDYIVRMIANDPVLITLVGSNGSIAYMGMETDLKSGASLDGQVRLDFSITYLYDPSPIP